MGLACHGSCSSQTAIAAMPRSIITGNFCQTHCKCYLIKKCCQLTAYVQDYIYCANKSACYHAMMHKHLHPATHTFCSPDNRHAHTHMAYGILRASPVSLSLRYQVGSMLARMSSILLTETSLCDSERQLSSTAARLSVPSTEHNSNALQ